MPPMIGGGKWQHRVFRTLHEANGALTIREISIRCGILREQDVDGNNLRMVLVTLARQGFVHRVSRGLYRAVVAEELP